MAELHPEKQFLLEEYKEVVAQFHKLTDIRFLLLTYLPLGTVFAAVLGDSKVDPVKQPAISAFALVATLCIATYDKRNDQLYDELVSRAAELERELHIEHGSFSDRPTSWLKYGGFIPVDHRWPIGLIYAAAASLWAYLLVEAMNTTHSWPQWLYSAWPMWLQSHRILSKLIAPALVIAGWQGLRWRERARESKLKAAIKRALGKVLEPKDDALQDKQEKLLNAILAEKILGFDKESKDDQDKAKRRVICHWEKYEKQRAPKDSGQPDPHAAPRAASVLLAAVIDLPARWIEDVWTGRR